MLTKKIDMKIYVLGGFAPDLSEQCLCTLSEVFNDEGKARERFDEIKREVEELLEYNYADGRIEYYSIDSNEVRHNSYTLGSLVATASIVPGKEDQVNMWREWSVLSIGVVSGNCICSKDVKLDIAHPVDFKVAAFGISVKEI